jgi:hypothetical protein
VVSITPCGKDPWHPLYRRLGGPQSQSGNSGQRKNPFASARHRTSITWLSSPQLDTTLTELPGSQMMLLLMIINIKDNDFKLNRNEAVFGDLKMSRFNNKFSV